MIEAAVAACPPELLLLGVTVLTSFDSESLRETGVQSSVDEQALRLASLGRRLRHPRFGRESP
jgi:orotidine-5'-phosphate decarboxylase